MTRENGLLKEQRGLAEIVGFLICTVAICGVATSVLVANVQRAELQASGLIDIMKKAEHRQKQLLSFVYSENTSENMFLYVFNYGTEPIVVGQIYISKDGGNAQEATRRLESVSAGNWISIDRIHPQALARFVFASPFFTGKGAYGIFVVTDQRAVYTFQVTV